MLTPRPMRYMPRGICPLRFDGTSRQRPCQMRSQKLSGDRVRRIGYSLLDDESPTWTLAGLNKIADAGGMEPVLRLRMSGGQVQLLQERGVSRVIVQAVEKGVHLRRDQTAVAFGIGSVQPFERVVGLVAESVNLSNFVRIVCMVFLNRLTQCCVRLFFST